MTTTLFAQNKVSEYSSQDQFQKRWLIQKNKEFSLEVIS